MMTHDQYTFGDPRTSFEKVSPPKQHQRGARLDSRLNPIADLGEESYRGTGRLSDRRALITGADFGIGAAVAIAYAREGADIAVSYLPSEQSDAERIAELVRDAGQQAHLFLGDILDAEFCRAPVADAVEKLGGLDIVVNNAGKQVFCEKLEDLTDEAFDQTFRTNVCAMFWITKASLPHLQAGATIINTTSVQAYKPGPVLVDYATTKAAINTFTKAIAAQLAARGIRVNAVAPGPVWTALRVTEGHRRRKSQASVTILLWDAPVSPRKRHPRLYFWLLQSQAT